MAFGELDAWPGGALPCACPFVGDTRGDAPAAGPAAAAFFAAFAAAGAVLLAVRAAAGCFCGSCSAHSLSAPSSGVYAFGAALSRLKRAPFIDP